MTCVQVYGLFGETLTGLVTLRAFRKQEQCLHQNQAFVDENTRAWWPQQGGRHLFWCWRVWQYACCWLLKSSCFPGFQTSAMRGWQSGGTCQAT